MIRSINRVNKELDHTKNIMLYKFITANYFYKNNYKTNRSMCPNLLKELQRDINYEKN